VLIPYGTVRRARSFPWVTTAIIVLNALVYVYTLTLTPEQFSDYAHRWGFSGNRLDRFYTILTMMWIHDPGQFLHLHVIGNMWALLVFGPQLEDAMGPVRYGGYYVLGGVASGLAHAAIRAAVGINDTAVMIGASGAVMSVLGMFAVRFYSTPVNTVVLVVPGVRLPAVVFLATYIGFDIRAGILQTFAYRMSGGVAHWAHTGGFLFGAAVGMLHGVLRQARREYLVERPVHDESQRVDRAVLLRDLVRRDPGDAEARLRLGTLLDADDRTFAEAASQYANAIRLLLQAGDDERARAAYYSFRSGGHTLAELAPDLAAPVASAYERIGRPQEAREIYWHLATADKVPERILEQALIRTATLAMEGRDKERAVYALQRILDDFPFSPWVVWATGALRRLTGEAF